MLPKAEQMKNLSELALKKYFDECLETIYNMIRVNANEGSRVIEVFFQKVSERQKGVTDEDLKRMKLILESDGFRVWLGSARNCGRELGITVRW